MEFDENRWQQWIILIAGGVALLVGILSWSKGLYLEWLLIRMLLSCVLIYTLCWGSVVLFNRSAPEETEIEFSSDPMKGSLLDIAVGSDEEGAIYTIPGQVDSVLSSGNMSSEQQAEIVRRMGWGEEK